MLKGGKSYGKKNIKQSKGIGSAGESVAVSNSMVKGGLHGECEN